MQAPETRTHAIASVVEAIGDTPLIRLRRASEATGCEILGKAEFMNPGQSVKDRAALAIIRDAEARGALRPGGLIVEGSAGNTAIGLAMVGRALGYRTLAVVPRNQADEKKDAIRLAGAELVEVDAAPYSDPGNYQHVSRRLAEARAATEPNGLIVEGTAGNTGIGLAMVGRALGYRTLVVIPRTQAEEKKQAIRLAGAELMEVDALPYANPGNYVRVSERVAAEKAASERCGAVWANQFDNLANREAHRTTTAPEIWEQTGGRIDGFICAIGTGGTLAGVAAGLRERRADVAIGLADPDGSAMLGAFTTGDMTTTGDSITEGIGQGRVTENLKGLAVDHAFRIPDAEALEAIYDLVQHEGLCVGGSAGVNVAGAVRLARALGPGKTIVTILCDGGQRYASKLFNPAFLRERGLPTPPWM